MPYETIDVASYLDGQVKCGHISRDDAFLIRDFCEWRKASRHTSAATSLSIAKTVSKFTPYLEASFKECSTSHLIRAINAVDRVWKQNTRRLRVYYLLEFSRWLVEEGHNSKIDLKKMDSIKPPKADKATKTAAQMIPEDKIDLMIRSCKNSRDRAMIAFMYEGALRPIEVREATWNQLVFDGYGAIFNTSKKTGKPRYIRFIQYSQYIATWKADYHPGNPEGDAPVFVTGTGNKLSRQYFDNILSHAAKEAGLKNTFPYLLRHSRITSMVHNKVPESVIKLQAWGSLSTPMMATYTHLSNDQIDDILLEKAGVKRVGRPKGPSIKPVQCPHCSTVNNPGAQFCNRCGKSLTDEAESEEEEVRRFAKSPEKLRLLADELEKEAERAKIQK